MLLIKVGEAVSRSYIKSCIRHWGGGAPLLEDKDRGVPGGVQGAPSDQRKQYLIAREDSTHTATDL